VLDVREHGSVEGGNITIVYRIADRHVERPPDLASDLVRLEVDVVVAIGNLAGFPRRAREPPSPDRRGNDARFSWSPEQSRRPSGHEAASIHKFGVGSTSWRTMRDVARLLGGNDAAR